MTKIRSPVFAEKIGVTPLVAAPGDNHPSDATVYRLTTKDWFCYSCMQQDAQLL